MENMQPIDLFHFINDNLAMIVTRKLHIEA